jgi:alkylhydroperoxidase/carboxymuconolactone decarboxylase family protein YurZ
MPINDILTGAQLSSLRDQFDPEEMNTVLGAPLPAVYPACLPYLETIGDLFYGGPTGDMTNTPFTAKNRERCLVAILAARGASLNLALHIYIALASHVSPNEIAHIVLLVGAYTGIDNFAGAVATEAKTLIVLGKVVDAGNARAADVFKALVLAFPS